MPRNSILYNPFALPSSGVRLFYPVGAAFLAVLTALTVLAALPNPWSLRETAVALTSGGKFSARIPDLQGTSLPQVASVPAAAQTPASTAVRLPILLSLAEWLPSAAGTLRPGDVPSAMARVASEGFGRPRHRMDSHRAPDATAAAARDVAISAGTESIKPDDGFTHNVLNSAQAMWSVTASAGGSLLSRLFSQ